MPTRKIAMLNQKGGVAKTTSVVNIGAGLQQQKQKVLLIDLDPQACLTKSLGLKPYELKKTVYHLLVGKASLKEVMVNRKGLFVVPSNIGLSGVDLELVSQVARESKLKKALGNLDEFDYLIIDCAPSLSLLTLNALVAVEEVLIPLQTEYLALNGIEQLTRTIATIKEELNPNLRISGVFGTRHQSREVFAKEALKNAKEAFPDVVFQSVIRENVALKEAPSYGKTIFEYKPKSRGAEDYRKLCEELLRRGI